jgi:N-dimethylarginine dimethylaminohydrolase
MYPINVKDETATLKSVVLGVADDFGGTPKVEDTYDPKSREHIAKGTFPKEDQLVIELDSVRSVFEKYNVQVYRPQIIPSLNQIFARDIAFVVENYLFKSNILPDRIEELDAIDYLIKQVNHTQVVTPPDDVHIEGGDVMLYGDYLFVGTYHGQDYSDYITARTNPEGVEFLKQFFPEKIVKGFDLSKSSTAADENALHLDCCFQPVGKGKAIIHKEGFRKQEDYNFLIDLIGMENMFHITKTEMYEMNSNIFSISPEVVISERGFTRLNHWMRIQGITVEEVSYSEVAKMGGLLRCSTLPLERVYE